MIFRQFESILTRIENSHRQLRSLIRTAFLLAAVFFFTTKVTPVHSQASGSELPGSAAGLANTPWPMFQHDPQHTGRSPLLIPQNQPELLFTVPLCDISYCDLTGSFPNILPGGDVLSPAGGIILRFDPTRREVVWFSQRLGFLGRPLLGADDSIYLGFRYFFSKMWQHGEVAWMSGQLDYDYLFDSGATFGADGNIYFGHNGLWSVTPDGSLRWVYFYSSFGKESPAAGLDGMIYANANTDLTAFLPTGVISWTLSTPSVARGNDPAISENGVIYLPSLKGHLYAISPAGTILWTYTPPEALDNTGSHSLDGGQAIAADGTIYYTLTISPLKSALLAVDPQGQLKWRLDFLPNPLTNGSGTAKPISIDRQGNILYCAENSHCYGISSQGTILWDFQLPLNNSVSLVATHQPILGADGLMYIHTRNSQFRELSAYADPAIYPLLTAPPTMLTFTVDPGAAPFTTSIPISSTVAPISYTVSLSSTAWLSLESNSGITPANIVLNFNPSTLVRGVYRSQLTVKPSHIPGRWLQIPITLYVGTHELFMPFVNSNSHPSNSIFHISYWFSQVQLATIQPDGFGRQSLAVAGFPIQISWAAISANRKVAAYAPNVNNHYEIWVFDTATGTTLLKIDYPGANIAPSLSPDGSQLAFVSSKDQPEGDIYKINVDGSGLLRLTNDSANETAVYWSPLGDKIVYQVGSFVTRIMNSDGSEQQPLLLGHYVDIPVGWSPDGRYLLEKASAYSGYPQLWLYDFQDGSYTMLSDKVQFKYPPVWSPDSQKIAFLKAVPYQYDLGDIFVINVDGSGETNLTNYLNRNYQQLDWSPDGNWIVFVDIDDLYVLHPDGTDLHRVTQNIQKDYFPFWIP